MVIAWHVDKSSGEAWVGMQTIARECNLEERSARRCVQNIERLGELQIVRGGGMQSNRYRILTPDTGDTPTPDAGVIPPLTDTTPPPLTPMTGDPCHTRPGTPVTDDRTPLSPTTPESNFKAKTKGGNKTPLPPDFKISERVKTWATAKGHGQLEEHFEAFIGKAQAHHYRYADWDAALITAIREDWAKVRTTSRTQAANQWPPGGQHSHAPIDWYSSDKGWQAKARELKIFELDFLLLQAKVCKQLGPGPWVDERNGTLMRLIDELPEAP